MSLSEPPLVKPDDNLDGLLRVFFRRQMPQSWSPPPLPAPRANRRMQNRSRWALAASIALLLFGSLLLSGRLASDNRSENVPGGPETSGNEQRRKMEQEHKNRQLHPRPELGFGDDWGDF